MGVVRPTKINGWATDRIDTHDAFLQIQEVIFVQIPSVTTGQSDI